MDIGVVIRGGAVEIAVQLVLIPCRVRLTCFLFGNGGNIFPLVELRQSVHKRTLFGKAGLSILTDDLIYIQQRIGNGAQIVVFNPFICPCRYPCFICSRDALTGFHLIDLYHKGGKVIGKCRYFPLGQEWRYRLRCLFGDLRLSLDLRSDAALLADFRKVAVNIGDKPGSGFADGFQTGTELFQFLAL